MTTIRRFTCNDLFTFNGINLDPLTETVRRQLSNANTHPSSYRTMPDIDSAVQYNFNFYLEYLARWPEYCQMAVGASQNNMGYSALRTAPACNRCMDSLMLHDNLRRLEKLMQHS
jgi:N-terminal acetyltransferase B complex catalytic subunit